MPGFAFTGPVSPGRVFCSLLGDAGRFGVVVLAGFVWARLQRAVRQRIWNLDPNASQDTQEFLPSAILSII